MTQAGNQPAGEAAPAGRSGLVSVAGESSAWAPLRQRAFRWLWLGVLISSVGTWMQTVGAQWLMGDLTHGSSLEVALIQTATSLPIFLFGFPAGALGDVFDRRRVEALLQEHRRGSADHSNIIWLLLNYAAWTDLYVRGRALAGTA